MLSIHPDKCVECGTREPIARWRRSSAKTTCPGSGPRSRQRTPASSTRSARPEARPKPGRCPTTRLCRQLRHQPVAAPCPDPDTQTAAQPPIRQPTEEGDLDDAAPRPQIASPPVLPADGATGPADGQVTGMRFRLEVRLTPADVGQRVVIRWRRPAPGDGDQIADVLGILEDADAESFAVRTSGGELVLIPAGRALAGKVIPPPPARRRSAGPEAPDRGAG